MSQSFHFIRPWWLLSLLPLLVLLPLWLRQLQQSQQLTGIIAAHLQGVLTTEQHSKHRLTLALTVFCWLFASLAAAGPSWLKIEQPSVQLAQGRVILLDASLATRANDVAPDRFEQLKFKAYDLLQLVQEGEIGLIAYSGHAFVVAPLTQDPANILNMLPALSPEIMPEQGQNPLAGIQEAYQLLRQAGYQSADILWLTAGIDREQMQDIRQFIQQENSHKNYRISILATGTQEGAPVRTQTGELLRDRQGRLIIPQLYPEYLMAISQLTQGRYFNAQTDNTDIQAFLTLPAQNGYTLQEGQQSYDDWVDFGPYLVLLLLPCFLWLALLWLGYRAKSTSTSLGLLPLIFTTVFAEPWFNVALAQTAGPTTEQVQPTESFISRLFKNKQQRAQQLYQQEAYEAAAQLATSHDLRGQAAYRAGDFAQAAEHFALLHHPEGYYNLGNSLAKNHQLEAAIAAYEQALALRPHWPEAQQNKQLLEELLQQEQKSSAENSEADNSEADNSETNSSEANDAETGDAETNDSKADNSATDKADTAKSESKPPNKPEDAEQQSSEQHEAQEPNEQHNEQGHEKASEQTETQQPLAWEDLTEEEREELQRLLRQLEPDPAILLRNRLLYEAQRRRLQPYP